MSSPDEARAAAGDTYALVNFLNPPSPPCVHARASPSRGTCLGSSRTRHRVSVFKNKTVNISITRGGLRRMPVFHSRHVDCPYLAANKLLVLLVYLFH